MEQARAAVVEAVLRTGEYDAAENRLVAALRVAEQDGHPDDRAAALDQLGVLAHFRTTDLPRDQWPSADQAPELDYFERALAIRRELGEPAAIAESLLHLGWVRQVLAADWVGSIPLFEEALALVGPDGDRHLRAELRRHVGFHVLLHEHRPDQALPHFQASLELWQSAGKPGWVVYGLAGLALCEAMAGRHEEATGHATAAVEQARAAGLRQPVIAHAEAVLRRVHELSA